MTRNGCGSAEWLYCDGNFDFGTVGCSSNVRTASKLSKNSIIEPQVNTFSAYPNPAAGQLTVEGSENYQVDLYDIKGRHVMQREHLKGKTFLNVSRLRPGIYIVKISDGLLPELRQRIVVE